MVVQLSQSTINYYLKFLIVGDSGVGKTSLLLSYCGDSFQEKEGATIGIDFRHKINNFNGKTVKLQIWDTAGQERFRTMTKSYFKMTQGIILVFDLTKAESLEILKPWIKEINEQCGENCPKVLVGNKCDLVNRRRIEKESASFFAKKNGMEYFETSCLEKENVNEVFMHLCKVVIEKAIDCDTISDYKLRLVTKSKSVNGEERVETKLRCCGY
jgi:small GTP-binding protein